MTARGTGVTAGPAIAAVRVRTEQPRSRTVSAWILLNASIVCKVAVNLWLVRFSLDHLGAQQYAVWVTMQSMVVYLLACEMGLGQTVMNWIGAAFAHEQHDRVNAVLTSGFAMYWTIVIVVWAAFSGLVLLVPVKALLFGANQSQLTVPVALSFWLLGTLTLARLPFVAFSAALGGLRELPARQWQEIVSQAGLVVATFSVLELGGGLIALVLGTGGALLAVGIAGYVVVTRRHTWIRIGRAHWQAALVRPMFNDSIYFFLSTMALMAQRSAGSLLAARYATLADVPVVFAVFMLIRVLGVSVADGVSRVLQPYIIMFWGRQERDRVRFFGALSTKVTFVVALIFSATLSLFAADLLHAWLGRLAAADGWFVGFLLIAFLIDMLFVPATNFMWVIGRHRRLALITGVYAIATIALGASGISLFPHRPLFGMAAGFLAASVITQSWMPYAIVRALEIGWREYVRGWIGRPLVLCIPAAAWLAAARLVPIVSIAARVELAIALAVSVGAVGWLIVLDADERTWLKRTINQVLRPATPGDLGLA